MLLFRANQKTKQPKNEFFDFYSLKIHILDDDISQAKEREALNNSKDKSNRMKMTGCLSPQ